MMTKLDSEAKCLKHLRSNYLKPSHPLFSSGPKSVYDFYNGKLSLKKIEDYLSSVESYTLFRANKKHKTNFSFVYR